MAEAPDADRFYLTCHPQVLRYLTRMVGSGELARDLTQETFLRATRAPAPDDEPSRRAWVFRIARNVALNHLRDGVRRARHDGNLSVSAIAHASQETTVVVREALSKLGPLDREVFLLRESAGLNYGEIAEVCGLTADAVRARLQRARQALRVMLEGTLAAERARGIRLSGRNHE